MTSLWRHQKVEIFNIFLRKRHFYKSILSLEDGTSAEMDGTIMKDNPLGFLKITRKLFLTFSFPEKIAVDVRRFFVDENLKKQILQTLNWTFWAIQNLVELNNTSQGLLLLYRHDKNSNIKKLYIWDHAQNRQKPQNSQKIAKNHNLNPYNSKK